VHTRDPRVAFEASKREIPFIYEDHNEDFHLELTDAASAHLDGPYCKVVVAITERVRERLVNIGVPIERILVLGSGVNSRSFDRKVREANEWRRFLLADRFEKLIVYTGGLQEVRGVAPLVATMMRYPRYMFAIAGGAEADVAEFVERVGESGIINCKVFGFVAQKLASTLQQAADLVLLTRTPGEQAGITSPLKFFEYLASGTPIVSADLPATEALHDEQAAVEWYDPANTLGLNHAIGRCLEKFPRRESGYTTNIGLAHAHTWERRQERLLEFAGVDCLT
jgi:glycosyltransferase involved in cell wall biosynthesis